MRKYFFVFAAVFYFVSTQAFADTEHAMNTMFKTWYETPIKEVVKYWGNPTDIDYKRGQTVYSWYEKSTRFIPGTMLQKKTECERRLIVDISGKVVYGTCIGNGCPFTTEGVKKWMKPDKDLESKEISVFPKQR